MRALSPCQKYSRLHDGDREHSAGRAGNSSSAGRGGGREGGGGDTGRAPALGNTLQTDRLAPVIARSLTHGRSGGVDVPPRRITPQTRNITPPPRHADIAARGSAQAWQVAKYCATGALTYSAALATKIQDTGLRISSAVVANNMAANVN